MIQHNFHWGLLVHVQKYSPPILRVNFVLFYRIFFFTICGYQSFIPVFNDVFLLYLVPVGGLLEAQFVSQMSTFKY